ncbi:hypothetical protein M0R45_030832 [Rubus argutus]|uniref:Uncharacterized protein n=1 Tax=Rubus argutus TaxID=59490 RepID=A0AAW1WGH9_RUBAR
MPRFSYPLPATQDQPVLSKLHRQTIKVQPASSLPPRRYCNLPCHHLLCSDQSLPRAHQFRSALLRFKDHAAASPLFSPLPSLLPCRLLYLLNNPSP